MDEHALSGALEEQEALRKALENERIEAENAQVMELFSAMLEATYLVAVADGDLSEDETGIMVRGFYNLTEGQVDEGTIQDMMSGIASCLAEEGQSARIDYVASVIQDDAIRDAVFVVASAVAWTDAGINVKQGLAIRALGKAFGYDENKHQQLLAQGRREKI